MPKARYFDHAATTPLHKRVLSAMLPYLKNEFGNPSNLYSMGRRAGRAVEESTDTIASILGCKRSEFVYTGSATEADNLAISGTARANQAKGNHIIVSQLEHKGILSACTALEKEGFEITGLPVGKNGMVDPVMLESALTPKTILVSVTYADSETGTLQPILEIAAAIRRFREKNSTSVPYFHTDATQAAPYSDINTKRLGVDMMTLSAHKIYGPKGIGGLFIRQGVAINPIIRGGGQEGGLRSGTENVPGIVGFAKALSLVQKDKKKEEARMKRLRDALERGILDLVPKVVVNGHPSGRLPNFLNISFLDIEGEALLLHLDELGIMVSTGSACNSQSLEPSAVLTALGNPYEYVHGSIRFTLGAGNTMEDVKYVLKRLPAAVKKLRAISPLELEPGQKKDISQPKAFVGGQTPHFLRKKTWQKK